MDNLLTNLVSTKAIQPLALIKQACIKGGMAATDEEKRKKLKKHR